jgi:hypothetical protein
MCRRPYTEYCAKDLYNAKQEKQQPPTTFCTNGGKCRGSILAAQLAPRNTTVNELYQNLGCICPPEFYGPHCEILRYTRSSSFSSIPGGNNTNNNNATDFVSVFQQNELDKEKSGGEKKNGTDFLAEVDHTDQDPDRIHNNSSRNSPNTENTQQQADSPEEEILLDDAFWSKQPVVPKTQVGNNKHGRKSVLVIYLIVLAVLAVGTGLVATVRQLHRSRIDVKKAPGTHPTAAPPISRRSQVSLDLSNNNHRHWSSFHSNGYSDMPITLSLNSSSSSRQHHVRNYDDDDDDDDDNESQSNSLYVVGDESDPIIA